MFGSCILKTGEIQKSYLLFSSFQGSKYSITIIPSLASIDQKYDVAISTACPFLEHILVDTADTSVQCIKFLQQHGLGRASFSILEKMEVNREQAMRPFHGPGNVHRLFDLVQVSL